MDESARRAVLVANRLVQMSRDCASMLATAAKVAESAAAHDLYRRRAATWADYSRALGAAVQELGGTPPTTPGAIGALQRAWIKINSAIGDAEAIAAGCAKREIQVLRHGNHAVQTGLPPSLRGIVEHYSRQIAEQQEASARRA